MLQTLRIKNFAIIDEAEIRFGSGLNILSGETGAGKSIIIQAISLLLGSRASADTIRKGTDEATVEGLFELSQMPWMLKRVDEKGFPTEGSDLLLKRVILRNGRHRIYVNGELATLGLLQDLCQGLVDLCGQHEHQSLLRPDQQQELLDRYGGLDSDVADFRQRFSHYRSLRKELETLGGSGPERHRRLEYLEYQLKELDEAALSSGEDEQLHLEKKTLQTTEERLKAASDALHCLEGDENGNVLDLLRAASNSLDKLSELDPESEKLKEYLDRGLAEAEELSLGLHRYLKDGDLDSSEIASELEKVQSRLSMIADLKRKYSGSLDDILSTRDELYSEYRILEGMGGKLKETAARLKDAEKSLEKSGLKLSKKRSKISGLLGESVTAELQDLKMAGAELSVDLKRRESLAQWSENGGADEIAFLIRTNSGEEICPLGKVASGGELSRVMLAIRRVIGDRGTIGVYLFDEIDAGIGGQTAFQVGKKLKSVSKFNQVICITHLPQVASFATQHYCVEKKKSKGRTVTRIVSLSKKERQEEVARMLGGDKLTPASLRNAAELLASSI